MQKFKTTGILNLFAGNLELDKDQLRRRGHLISDNGNGTYAILNPVQFKAGEEFGFDGEIPKALAEIMSEITGEPAVEYPIHRGAGVYELSNGEKVKGKAAAFEAEASLADD